LTVEQHADGRPQWDYMTKEENSAPTVSIEAWLLSVTIDAMEERDIAFDIPGAFMQADMNDTVHHTNRSCFSEHQGAKPRH